MIRVSDEQFISRQFCSNVKLLPGYSWNARLFCNRTFACYEYVYCKLYAVMIASRERIIDFCVHYV